MGFDCTLHVVDEGSLRRFSARLLRGAHRDGPFDADASADARLAEARRLAGDDPPAGARAIAALALAFVSREAPHVASRGFALSLWDEGALGKRPPAELLASVAEHLPEVAAAHPGFAEHAPRAFDGNYAVGPFVAAVDVPALLAHLERAVGRLVPGARAPYLPLVRVLRVAAARRLAYWEGTDLAVAQAHEEWLAEAVPAGARVAPSPITSAIARPLAVAPGRWLVHEHWRLHDVAFGAFPPRVTTREGLQVTALAITGPGALFARVATDPSVRPYVFANVELPAGAPLATPLPFEVARAYALADGLLLLPSAYEAPEHLAPHVLRNGALEKLEVPAPTCKRGALEHGAAPFGDGAWLLLWDRRAYLWDGSGPPRALGATPLGTLEDPLSAVTLDDGAIVGAFGRKLVRIDRAGQRKALLPLGNLMHVARGPAGALVLHEGDNPEGDALKILWPNGAVTHVAPSALGLAESPTRVTYDEAEDAVVALARGAWHSLAWEAIDALPRVDGAVFAKEHARLGRKMR